MQGKWRETLTREVPSTGDQKEGLKISPNHEGIVNQHGNQPPDYSGINPFTPKAKRLVA